MDENPLAFFLVQFIGVLSALAGGMLLGIGGLLSSQGGGKFLKTALRA